VDHVLNIIHDATHDLPGISRDADNGDWEDVH
jgi:hypothetical protein